LRGKKLNDWFEKLQGLTSKSRVKDKQKQGFLMSDWGGLFRRSNDTFEDIIRLLEDALCTF